MPGKLYFYVNFGTILLNKKGAKVKQLGRPMLRDLEWMFFYNWEEARGFSGFEDDDVYSCNRLLVKEIKIYDDHGIDTEKTRLLTDEELKKLCMDPETNAIYQREYNNLFDSEGRRKKYMPAREYLRMIHDDHKGAPLYFNEAKNFMMLGSRGFGKSYSVAGLVAHEFLFDGKTDIMDKSSLSAEILVGAFDSKYTSDILSKVELMITNLPGKFTSMDRFGKEKVYPCPFFKNFSGSWKDQITARYRKKVAGQWEWVGSKTNIKNRTFRDNPFAANGTRPGVMVFEEIGMFNNLLESYNSSVECQRNGAIKFGSMMFLGTGGDFEGGGTIAAYEMFYNPDKYDILKGEDIWENRGDIAYFVPAYLGLNQYKELPDNNTNIIDAYRELEQTRAELRSHKGNSAALNMELQYRPLKPSEIFLASTGNIFPIAELKDRLNQIRQNEQFDLLEKRVTLYFDKNQKSGVNYQLDVKGELVPINEFPWKQTNREGCVTIYEFPQTDKEGNVPQDLYIIGHDPYANDNPDGPSLGAIYVMKTKAHWQDHGHDEIVASYVGRPYEGRLVINDILMKLSMFYGNAKIYFENVRGNVKEYFEKNKRLDLLAKRPQTLFNKKASFRTTVSQEYGYPMTSKTMKMDGLLYIRDWLVEPRMSNSEGEMVRNLDRIWDRALLQELVAFNLDGNFDRVMGFMGCIIGLNETQNIYEHKFKELSKSDRTHLVDIDFLTVGSAKSSSFNIREINAHRRSQITSIVQD